MKYVSNDQLELYYEKNTEKAICFINYAHNYTDKPQYIWIPKALIKIAYNSADDYLFFIPSWYYMQNLTGKLYNSLDNILPKHGTLDQIKKTYKNIIDANKAEFD